MTSDEEEEEEESDFEDAFDQLEEVLGTSSPQDYEIMDFEVNT